MSIENFRREWLCFRADCLAKGSVAMTTPVIALCTSLLMMTQAHLAMAEEVRSKAVADSSALEEVTVTAQRRNESVQNISIAITAISGDALREKNVLRQLDLQNVAPGLTIAKAGLTESVNIRGIGLASGSPQVTNGVGMYLDGVFQPPIVSAYQFYDMDGVEVLRGPQGTLVGANSTGGAIYLKTKKPTLAGLEGNVALWAGSFGHHGATAAVNIPMGQTLALRLGGLTDDRDSYYKNLGTSNASPDRLTEHDGRAQLLWRPNDQFQAVAKFEVINKESGGYAFQPIPVAPLQYAAGATGKPWTVSYDSPTGNHERANMSGLDMKYVFANGMTLRSVTGYLDKKVNNLYDSDATSLPISAATPQATSDQFVRERQFSEELNLISPDNGAFKYVLGAYSQRNKINVRIDSATLRAVGGAVSHTYIQPDTDKKLQGLFGQTTYDLNEKLTVEAGLRYSHFNVEGTGGVYAGVPSAVCTGVLRLTYVTGLGCNVAPQTGTESDGSATGKLGLSYKLDADNMLYTFLARGYKNGGINPPGGTFKPETVWDLEAGWKSSFLDRHVRTQFGAFYNDYKNFQEDVTNPSSGGGGVTNLTSAKLYGLEASMQARVGQLSLDGSLAYTHSSMSAFSAINRALTPAGVSTPQCSPAGTSGTAGTGCFNYYYFTTSGGNQNLFSPTWTGNVTAEYSVPLAGDMSLAPRVGYSYIGSQWNYVTYDPRIDAMQARGILNAGVAFQNGRFKLDVFGTNLANRYYIAGRSGNNSIFGAPREYGVRVGFDF